MPTNKVQALENAIKQALSDVQSYPFKDNLSELKIVRMSDIVIQGKIKCFPSEVIDDSNLEDCESGRFDATFNVFTINPDNEKEIRTHFAVYDCDFSVNGYKNGEFAISIPFVNAERR